MHDILAKTPLSSLISIIGMKVAKPKLIFQKFQVIINIIAKLLMVVIFNLIKIMYCFM